MRVAIVCLGYLGNPSGIDVLAEYFSGMDVDLYVHIDAKIDISPYADLSSKRSNVTLLSERRPIFWGGFSIVRAIVGGLETANATRSDYTRFFVLSEDTIPLRSRAEMWERATSSEEFFWSLPAPAELRAARYDKFCYPDSPATSLRGVRMDSCSLSPSDFENIRRLLALHGRGKAPVNVLHHGPGWWGLSKPHVERLLAAYHGDPWLRESFEFSLVPEEQYFHTILGEIPNSSGGAVFADFSRDLRPHVYRTADEIISAKTGRHLFLRKVALGEPVIAEFVRFLG
ncbi:MAG: hypothetical protein KIS96_02550 [Bauldia sp.]|nr:hypothetical protein [Bauldia sp.]